MSCVPYTKLDLLIADHLNISTYKAYILRQNYLTSEKKSDLIDSLLNGEETQLANGKMILSDESRLQRLAEALLKFQQDASDIKNVVDLSLTNMAATFYNLFQSMPDGVLRIDAIDTISRLFMDCVSRFLIKSGKTRLQVCNDPEKGTMYILKQVKMFMQILAQLIEKGQNPLYTMPNGLRILLSKDSSFYQQILDNFEGLAAFALVKLHNIEGIKYNKNINVAEFDDLISSNKNDLEAMYDHETAYRDSWQELKDCISPMSTVGLIVRTVLATVPSYEVTGFTRDGNPIIERSYNKLGFPKYESASTLHQKLMRVLRGMNSSKDMMNRLYNYGSKTEDDPILAMQIRDHIIPLITTDRAMENKINSDGNLTDAQRTEKLHAYTNVVNQLRSAFYRDLKRSKQKYSILSITRSKIGLIWAKKAIINAEREREGFFNNFISFLKTGTAYNMNSDTSILSFASKPTEKERQKALIENVDNLHKSIGKFLVDKNSGNASKEQLTHMLIEILSNMGIDSSVNQAYSLINNKKFILKLENFASYGLGAIKKLTNTEFIKTAEDLFTKKGATNSDLVLAAKNDKNGTYTYNIIGEQFRELAEYFATERAGSILDAGLYKKKGKYVRMYTDVAPSYMADRIEEIQAAVETNNIENVRNIIRKHFFKNPIFVSLDENGVLKTDDKGNPIILSWWLRELWNSNVKGKTEIDENSFAANLDWDRVLGTSRSTSGWDLDAKDFSEFDISDHALSTIRNYLNFKEIHTGKFAEMFANFPIFIMGDANVFKSLTAPKFSTKNDDWVNLFYEVYQQERQRMDVFNKTNQKLRDKGYKEVENTENNKAEYTFLKFLNEYDRTHTTKFHEINDKEKQKRIIKFAIAGISEKEKEAIEDKSEYEWIKESEVQRFQQRMLEAGVYEQYDYTYTDKDKVKHTEKKYRHFPKYNTKTSLDELMMNFYINNKMAVILQMQIMTVDVGYYKNSKDLQKRYKEIHAPGNEMDVYAMWDDEYILQKKDAEKGVIDVDRKGVYFDDIEGSVEDYDPAFADVVAYRFGLMEKTRIGANITSRKEITDLGKETKNYRDYLRATYTDGQSFVTLNTMRKIDIMLGLWGEEKEHAYKEINRISQLIFEEEKKENPSDEKIAKYQLMIINLATIFQPKKPYGFSHERCAINDNAEALIPVQYKCAEALIIPATLPKDSKLRALGQFMLNKGLDYACSTQCIKVGNFGSVNITNTSLEDLDTVLSKAYVHKTSWADYKIQTNVPHHLDSERAMGTQIRKIILSGIKKGNAEHYKKYFEKIFAELKEHGIDLNGIMIDSTSGPTMGDTSGNNIINLYNSLISCGIYEALHKFKDKIEDIDKFSEILQHNVLTNDRQSAIRLLNYVLNDEGDDFDFSLFEGGNEFDNTALLLSLFRKLVNKQMFDGASLVQVSAWGTKRENVIEDKDLTSICDGDNVLYYQCIIPFILHYTDLFGNKVDLKFEDYCHSDGSLIMSGETTDDIEFASWENKTGKGGKYLIPKIEKDFPGILDLIAYRIPTERNYSCLNLKVVKFSNPADGGIIKVPLQTTIVAGFDFDIDKLYLLRKTFNQKDTSLNNEKIFNAIYEDLNEELGINVIEKLKEAAKKHGITKDFHKAWDYVPELKDYNKADLFKAKAKELNINISKFQWLDYDWTKAPSQQTDEDSKIKDVVAGKRNNALFHLMRQRLMDEETLDSRITPGGFQNPKTAAKAMRELLYNDSGNRLTMQELIDYVSTDNWEKTKDPEPDWDATDAYTLFHYNQLNQIAAKLIGVFANANTFKQYASVAWSMSLAKPIEMMGKNFGNLLQSPPGRDSDLTLAEFLAASVDAVKDPVLNYLNLNEHTANVACLLGAIGYNPTEIGVFLNQPIIKEAVAYSRKTKTSLSKSIKKILSDDKFNGLKFSELDPETIKNGLEFKTLAKNIKGSLDPRITTHKDYKEDKTTLQNQFIVAHQMLECLKSASDFTKLVQSTKFTASNSVTSSFGGLYSQQMKIDEFYQGEISLEDGSVKKNGLENIVILTKEFGADIFTPILNDGNMYSKNLHEYIRTVMRTPFGFELAMFDANKALLKIISKYFPYETDTYVSMRKTASNCIVSGVVSDDTIDALHQHITISILENLENSPFNPNSIIKSGEDYFTMREYFTRVFPNNLMRLINSGNLTKKYPFLKSLIFNAQDDYTTINVDKNSFAESYMDDEFAQGWDSLMRDPNPAMRQLGVNLFFYNFHTGGYRFGYNMFMNLCPNSVKEAIVASIENGEQVSYLLVLNQIKNGTRNNLGTDYTTLLWDFVLKNPNVRDFVKHLYGNDKDSARTLFREAAKNNATNTIIIDGNENSKTAKLYQMLSLGKKKVEGVEKPIEMFPVAVVVDGDMYIANYNKSTAAGLPINTAQDGKIEYTKVELKTYKLSDDEKGNIHSSMTDDSLSDIYFENLNDDEDYQQLRYTLQKFAEDYVRNNPKDSLLGTTLQNTIDELHLLPLIENRRIGNIRIIEPEKLFDKLKGDPAANYRHFKEIAIENLLNTVYKDTVKYLNNDERKELINFIADGAYWNRSTHWANIKNHIDADIQDFMTKNFVDTLTSEFTAEDLKARINPKVGTKEINFTEEENQAIDTATQIAGNDEILVDGANRVVC